MFVPFFGPCGSVLITLLNFDSVLFQPNSFVFLLSVCSQRLHTEVVLREGKHNLWNLSPGLFSKWIRTTHSALILMIFICNLLKLYWHWEEKKNKKKICLQISVLFWFRVSSKNIFIVSCSGLNYGYLQTSLSLFFFNLLGVKVFCDILVSLPSKNWTSFGF